MHARAMIMHFRGIAGGSTCLISDLDWPASASSASSKLTEEDRAESPASMYA